jgi:hypothetical protein
MFGRRNRVHEPVEPDMSGRILVRITSDRVDRATRKVKLIIICRSTGKTLFKLRFNAEGKTDQSIYYYCSDMAKGFAKEHDLIIDRITSNIDMPYIRNSNKRSR